MKINQYKNVRQPMTTEQYAEKLKQGAELYEKQFLREMVKAMRGTVSESEFMKPNQAEKIFREELDHEYVEKWGDRGGIGLADMIYKQLLDKAGLSQRPTSPRGPVKLGERDFQPKVINPQQAGPLKMQYEIPPQAKNIEVTAPWSGSLLGAQQINPDEYLLQMTHDNGLKSQMVFRGTLDKALVAPEALGKAAEIQAGQRLGMLSPDAKNLFWTVDSVE